MPITAKLDEFGKPAWIALIVLGFMVFWPLGLAILVYTIWSGRMGCGYHGGGVDRWGLAGPGLAGVARLAPGRIAPAPVGLAPLPVDPVERTLDADPDRSADRHHDQQQQRLVEQGEEVGQHEAMIAGYGKNRVKAAETPFPGGRCWCVIGQ